MERDSVVSTVITAIVFLLSYLFLPIDTSTLTTLPDRLSLTIPCLFVSSLSIVMGIVAVGSVRGNSNAIDPVYGRSEHLVDVPNRILRNTTEQFILHMMVMLALTVFLEGSSMKVIPILSGIFLIARIVYHIGYIYVLSDQKSVWIRQHILSDDSCVCLLYILYCDEDID